MSSFDQLTLLVFLKDRFAFTKRLCSYLQDIKYPFHVIFADGSELSENEEYFRNECFSFNHEYVRYPVDKDIYAYARKAQSASALVKTPYVMLCDNDDFPIVSGQRAAVDFMENNQDCVGCNGRIKGLIPYPDSSKPNGKHIFWKKYYSNDMDFPVNLDQDSVVERITSWQPFCCSIWYSIFKSEVLKQMYKDMDKMYLSDLGPMELFFSYFMLSKGKVSHINETTYIRQLGSSQAAASQGNSFFMRLFFKDWLGDIRKIMDYMQCSYPNEKMPTGQSFKDYLYYIFAKRSDNSYCIKFKSKSDLFKFALERKIFLELFILKFFPYIPDLVSRFSKFLNIDFDPQEAKAIENTIIDRAY
ncbi:MAG: TIGR00180 family glycosyltransferase [Holosporales bacterium]|jgi:glycosyltransferase domain-containing protein|nr:TIGR00180 family glycosyltransferase [Holosporales bacterium]